MAADGHLGMTVLSRITLASAGLSCSFLAAYHCLNLYCCCTDMVNKLTVSDRAPVGYCEGATLYCGNVKSLSAFHIVRRPHSAVGCGDWSRRGAYHASKLEWIRAGLVQMCLLLRRLRALRPESRYCGDCAVCSARIHGLLLTYLLAGIVCYRFR